MEPGTSQVASSGSPQSTSSTNNAGNSDVPAFSDLTSQSANTATTTSTSTGGGGESSASPAATATASTKSSSSNSPSLKFTGTVSRFCDYFVICGLDYSSGLEVLHSYESDGNRKLFYLWEKVFPSNFFSMYQKNLLCSFYSLGI